MKIFENGLGAGCLRRGGEGRGLRHLLVLILYFEQLDS